MSDKRMSRREFVGTTTVGLLASGLTIPRAVRAAERRTTEIVCRTLGRTGLRLPVISFGVMNSDNPDLLRKALDLGIRHLDTANVYLRGNSERVIGQVVEETGKREQVVIGTKMRFARDREKNIFVEEGTGREPGATAESLFSQLDTSLERLRTDYVDILYLHSCYSAAMATHETLLNAMVKVKEAGKARYLGVSTHSHEAEVIRAAVDTGVCDVVLTAYNVMQDHRDEVGGAIAYAAGKGVGVVAMKTQGGVRMNQREDVEINHAASLKWVLSNEHVCTTIPGMTTFDQVDHNVAVMASLELSGAERRELELSASIRGGLLCQGCRECVSSCPARVEVPVLMRAYMYSFGYGNSVQAAITVEQLSADRGLDACGVCPSCSVTCRRGIDVGRRTHGLIAEGFRHG